MRSIFNHRFRILLYWYIIIKCIHYTNQQDIIIQKVTGQKNQKLADTSHSKNTLLDKISNHVTTTSICSNCTIVSSSNYDEEIRNKNRKTTSLLSALSYILPQNENHNYEFSLSSSSSSLSSKKISQNSHQRHQNFYSSQSISKQKISESNENSIQRDENDSLEEVDSYDQNSGNHITLPSSTTTPSQLPSPPSSLPFVHSVIAETLTITPSETEEFKSESKIVVSGITTETTTTTTTSSSASSSLRESTVSEIKPTLSVDNSREVNYDNDGGKNSEGGSNNDILRSKDNTPTKYNGDNNHRNFGSMKTTDFGRNNIFFGIFNKFSLANIFGGGINNDSVKNSLSDTFNNYDSVSNNHHHYHIINDMISDVDNNHSKDVTLNVSHIRRTKRIKRDSSASYTLESNNKELNPSSSSSSASSSSSSSLSSTFNSSGSSGRSSLSSSAEHKEDVKFRSSDISSGSDIKLNETSPSLASDLNKTPNHHQQQQKYQLTTHPPNDDGINLTLNTFIEKNVLSEHTSKLVNSNEPMVIIDENGGEEYQSGLNIVPDRLLVHRSHRTNSNGGNGKGNGDSSSSSSSGSSNSNSNSEEEYMHGDDPRVLPSGPIIRGPYYDNEQQQHMTNDDDIDDDGMSVVYAEQHSEIKLICDVNSDIATSVWLKNGQIVHTLDRNSRTVPDYRFIKEPFGGLTITNVMLEDDGEWQCEAENSRGLVKNARPIKLVVLDRPKPPYLLIDSRRLDAGNIFVPVKENSELSLACISEGGNPKPTLTWEVLLSPGVDRHAQKVAAEVLELEEIKNEKDKEPYKINSGAKSEARLPAVYRAHHNARILCVMEHPTLKIRQNASLLLDVQYTPSFAISRTPGFGYPLREGIEVSLKCDVDSNPPSTPRWQKDDGDTPVPQTGDGFLNFTSIRREHSGWYKCTSRHLNFQYSSIGYYLSVRYDSVDVTSEPDDQEVSVAASHNPNKGQLEVQLGGAVTLQCPQGSLGCWSHLDPVTARLRGLGVGLSQPTGQFSLKDVVYQDAGTYKCIGQSPNNKKKLEVLQTVGVLVKGAPTVTARNSTPVAYPGSPLHLTVEFCANPPAYAARWLHGDRVYTPGNQYGSTVLAYGVSDLPTPFCKEARLTYVSMHERVPRTFYFIVSSPGGVAEAIFKVNFTLRYRTMSNSIDDEEDEELSEPEEIHFPVFGNSISVHNYHHFSYNSSNSLLLFTSSIVLLLLSKLFTQKFIISQLCTINNVFSS